MHFSNYNIENENTIHLSIETIGGGKRALSRPAVNTITNFKDELDDKVTLLKTLKTNPLSEAVLTRVAKVEELLKNQGDRVMPLALTKVNGETPKNLSMSTSTEFTVRTSQMSKAIFAEETAMVLEYDRSKKLSEEILYLLTAMAMTKSYHQVGAGMSWTKLQFDMLNLIQNPPKDDVKDDESRCIIA